MVDARPASAGDLPDDAVDGWIDRTARFGFITKGVVYGVVGVLALQAAMGAGGATEGTRGAILEIGKQPFGQVLLALSAIGLLAYAVWRFIEAGVDPERAGSDAKGLAKRAGYVVSGIVYLGLSIWAAQLVLAGRGGDASGGGGGGSADEWTATLMSQPFGRWLVASIGAIIVAVGLYHFYKAYRADFMRRYAAGDMNERQRRWARRLGQFGLAARGVTFGIIGGFLITAALEADPTESGGLSEALQTLAAQPYGPWLLGIVALGLVAYGGYCISKARFSHFSPD